MQSCPTLCHWTKTDLFLLNKSITKKSVFSEYILHETDKMIETSKNFLLILYFATIVHHAQIWDVVELSAARLDFQESHLQFKGVYLLM